MGATQRGQPKIYSVAQTATLTTLAWFLSSGLTAVSGAPAFDRNPEIQDIHTTMPWAQPCGTASLRQGSDKYSVYRTLKHVQRQLKWGRNHFRKELKDVREIYFNVSKVLKEQYRYSWLLEKQLLWYHKEAQCLEKEKKAEKTLPQLHDVLQRFAITFHHLKAFKLKSHINTGASLGKRNKIVDEMNTEILRMLCEVKTAMVNLRIPLPAILDGKMVSESSNWAREGDLTTMLIQDWGVLQKYQKFLNEWTRIIRHAIVLGKGPCDPTKVEPLSDKPKIQKKPGGKGTKQKTRHGQGQKKKPSGQAKKLSGAKRPGKGRRKMRTTPRPIA